jgi:hypothetical protein
MSADGGGTNEIMRRTGKSKTCVWRTDEHELAKTKVHGSSPKDQYDGNLCLFLGNDLAGQGEGISLIREQV